MTVQAIVNVYVVSIYTGEIFEMFEQIWLGDYSKIYNEVASRYVINKTEREGDIRTIWVQK